jgi:hypothetical protein
MRVDLSLKYQALSSALIFLNGVSVFIARWKRTTFDTDTLRMPFRRGALLFPTA